MAPHATALVWAQWRSTLNQMRRGTGTPWLTLLVAVVWYGAWVFLAVAGGLLASRPDMRDLLPVALPSLLLLALLYWQAIPILMVSTGSSLDLRKLLPYPVPHSQLFGIEVLLRVTTGVEMVLMLLGVGVGLAFNPRVPTWGPLAFLPFALVNMLLSAGVRDLLTRLLSRRGVREAMVILLVLVAALPQLLLVWGPRLPRQTWLRDLPWGVWPWTATARIALGTDVPRSLLLLCGWLAVAYWFGRRQFETGLRYDFEAARAAGERPPGRRAGLLERLYVLPSRLLPDPVAALVEKDLRILSRSARFRLVFLMGFSFGLLIWLPLAFGSDSSREGFLATHYLTLVYVYALMLMGEVTFWNAFGFDRTAAQLYFVTPAPLRLVLVAKNLTTLVAVLAEVVAITLVCRLVGLPIGGARLAESLAVTLVVTAFLLALGNVASSRSPHSVDPSQSWRKSAAGKVQALLLVIYPALALPIVLAYLAGYAFDSAWAFYGVLAVDLLIAAILYGVALDSAVSHIEGDRERFLAPLSRGGGPVAS